MKPIRFAYGLLLGMLLAACSNPSTPSPNNPTGQEPPEILNGYVVDGYTLMLPLSGEQLQDALAAKTALEQQHSGKMMVWDENPEDPFCVLKVPKPPLSTAPNAANTSLVTPNLRSFVSGSTKPLGSAFWANGSAFWANGSAFWANGSAFWANGSAFWANGGYTAIQENNALWQQIGLEAAFQAAPNLGKGIKVAILDTGIDLQHFMFSGALAPAGELYDFVGEDSSPQEEGTLGKGGFGHGTNVAGIVRQIAPNATLLPLRVLDASGEGNPLSIARAIYHAVKHGAKIINLSLGSSEPAPLLERAIRNASRQGVLFTISAGNDRLDTALYPAYDSCDSCDKLNPSAPSRLSVGSVNGRGEMSSFSNHNNLTTDFFEARVELGAPGEVVFGPVPGGFKGAWSGTSQAAPVVAGVLALALGQQSGYCATAGVDLPSLLLRTTAALSGNSNALLGAGRLDAAAFLASCAGQR